jgi:hypothetical protein
MPTPTKPKILGAKHASLVAGVYVTFKNLSRSGKVTVEAASGEAVITETDWEEGDIISIEVSGKYLQSTTATVSKVGIKPAFSAMTADTKSPAINL